MYDLHVHSEYSDGRSSIESIVKKAKEANLEAVAIADHSIEHPLGLTKRKAKNRRIEIERAMAKYGIKVIDAIECGIQPDGKIIKPEHDFELVLASIHDPVSKEEYHRRIKLCLSRNSVDILAHFHSRIFDAIGGVDENGDDIILDLLEDTGVCLEINTAHSAPPTTVLEKCIDRKLKFSVGSDSHSLNRVAEVEWGFQMAKKYLRNGKSII